MKYSRSLTSVVVFRPETPRCGSRAGKIVHGVPFFKELLLQTGRLKQQTECIAVIYNHVRRSVVILGFIRKSNFWRVFDVFLDKSESNFISSGSKIVKRLRRRQYDPEIIEKTIGLVLGPFTALYRSFLKRCTLTNKAVGTIWRALSKLPQRRQGPDPRPLWLLVGTPSAFGPELAYRLRVAQPTLMDVPICFIYFYITIYVCVSHFYYLSALVGCWSSVSIMRIIYKFLKVCPFDCTAVAVSGKVERS